jgi:alpha-galactosidase
VAAALICCAFLTCLPQTINAAEKAAQDKGGALEEKNELRKWVGMTLPGEAAAVCPFSLTYDGNPSAKLLSQWERIARNLSAVSGKERRVTTWTDKRTGLEITCEMTLFTDFPAVEWLLRLKNTGTQPTPILENIRPLDMTLPLDDRGPIVFHHAKGSNSAADDYMTIDTPLAAGQGIAIPAAGQRAQTYLPYFNIETQRGGLVGAIGWTGQWALSVQRQGERTAVVQAGQKTTHLKLLPGESIRTPRILLVRWRGSDRMRGHNLLRRVLLAHYVPRVEGRVATPLLTQNMWEVFDSGNATTEQNQLEAIARMPSMNLEGYWLDAGWFEGGWPNGVGSWMPRTDHFPRGLRPLGDAAHKAGLKFVLWFEPERVADGSRIAREHPGWLLARKDKEEIEIPGRLFNLGNPEARRWLTDFLSQCITDWGVDVYRQDRNFYPYRFWRDADVADRQGITEIRHVQGLYEMWDELLRRHPGLIIDNANWRGTGPDLEMVMRSAGSWTSSEAAQGGANRVFNQVQMAGLSLYVPIHASLLWGTDPYSVRSVARFGTSISYDTRPASFSVPEMKQAGEEIRSLRPLYLGDYYPLTAVDLDEQHWCGWQFDRPDLGQGFAMFFRRPASPDAAYDAHLSALEPEAQYDVSFAETYQVKEKRHMTGRQLASLHIEIDQRPGSILIRYAREKR